MDDTEKAAELEAEKEVKEEEVRANIITEYGFDEVDDAERIDKLVTKEMEHSQKLSTAIRQKIKHRTEAETLRNDPRLKESQKSTDKPSSEDIDKVLDTKLLERLEQRDLDEMETSDDIKAEIKKLAKVQGITVKQAARDPYIVYKQDEYAKVKKADEAAITRTNRSSGTEGFSLETPPDVDMSTEEGQKKYGEWKKWAIKQGA